MRQPSEPKAKRDPLSYAATADGFALEVHDNDLRTGDDRWAPGAVVRWRDVALGELSLATPAS